jgi:hypothetical protein
MNDRNEVGHKILHRNIIFRTCIHLLNLRIDKSKKMSFILISESIYLKLKIEF